MNLKNANHSLVIGSKVVKESGKPFKGGAHIVVVSGVINHPITQRPAFTFSDCEGYVECRQCELYVEDPERYIGKYMTWLDNGIPPNRVQAELSRRIQQLMANPDTIINMIEMQAIKQLESDIIRVTNGSAI